MGTGGVPTAPFRDRPRGRSALLITDMIGTMDFEGAEAMAGDLRAAAEAVARLREDAEAAGLPVIYVNDNFGEWHSEASRLVDRARGAGGLGRWMVERLAPAEDDYFIIKPQFSGFYATNLPVLLPKLGVSRLILTGLAADICVLFTAADAHMRDYALWVPEDCVVAGSAERRRWALAIISGSMGAEVRGSRDYRLEEWLAEGDAP